MRQGLASLIDDEPDLSVCGGAESPDEAIQQVAIAHPDVVVVDIGLGNESGLDLIKRLHHEHPSLPLLALSMHDESLYAERALRAGALGYIMKKEAMDKVMTAIRCVLGGEIFISPRMASRVVNKLLDKRGVQPNSPLEQLTDREFQVFSLISKSVGPTEIAARLDVSVKTVETHREHIKSKLGLKSGPELTRFALEWAMAQR